MGRELATLRHTGLAVVLGVLLGGALSPAAAQMVLYEDGPPSASTRRGGGPRRSRAPRTRRCA
jgi:hypothetical protein